MKCFFTRGMRMAQVALIILSCATNMPVWAQMASEYQFSSSTGTYTEISSNATALPAILADDVLSDARNIGFTFIYEGTGYTQFKMSSNGFISFNTAGTNSRNLNNFSTANASSRPVIAPLWDDLDGRATGNVSYAGYELTGMAPNRVLTVEWRNWEWGYESSNPVISFQVKLYETTNVIEFVYRQESGAVASGSASIGIGSATGSGSNSYLNVTDVATPAVSSTTSVTNINTKPATGQVFVFTPPPPCSGIPVAGTASADSAACSGGRISLNLTGYSSDLGIAVQWQESFMPNIWSNIPGATAAASFDTFTGPAQYRAAVICTITGDTAYSNVLSVGNHLFYACYCSPLSGQQLHTNTGNYIKKVTIANTTLNNTTTSAGAGGYTRYYPSTAGTTGSMYQGVTYELSVMLGTATYTGMAWIDYDQSGTFDTAEAVTVANGGITMISIPVNAVPGLTGMRIRAANATPYTSGNACSNLSNGYETEDYIVNIAANQQCSGIPATAGNAASDKDTLCVSGDVTLTLTGYPPDFGINILWQMSPAGANNFTDIPGSGNDVYTVTNLNASMDFRAMVSCANPGGGMAYSNIVPVVVRNPALLSTLPGARCDAGKVALYARAAAGLSVLWYDTSAGGVPVGTGNVFITPSINATTSYFAAATEGGFNATTAKATYTANPTSGSGTTNFGLVFDVLSSFTLESVTIYPISATNANGTVTIDVLKSNNTILHTATFNVTGSPSSAPVPVVLNLGFNLPPGTNYKLRPGSFTGISGMLFDPSANATGGNHGYPYVVPGIVSINTGTLTAAPTNTARNDLYYYFYDWKIAKGCVGTLTQVDATINTAATSGGLATGGTVVESNQADGTTIAYDALCSDKVVAVTDASGGNVLGNTSATVRVMPVVQTYNNMPYVPRVYDITPASNGEATVTLYALQSEFDAYNTWINANNPGLPLLPANGSDPNISNIAITQWHGVAGAGSAGPGGLYGTNSAFIPNASVTATTNGTYWTLTFPVTGFSGFFIHSGSIPLPIELASIHATNIGNSNRIDWTTANEKELKFFELERSADATDFVTIAAKDAMGRAGSYEYRDSKPLPGMNYYRLKMHGNNRQFAYSSIVKAFVNTGNAFMVEAYPNPASDVLTIKVNGVQADNARVSIVDITGKVIRDVKLNGAVEQVDISSLAKGFYMVRYSDDMHTQTLKLSKR